jgi:lipopolysaccharide export system protein LptC
VKQGLGWRALEHAQAGLPVLAAGVLAAFTWWLVQSSPHEQGGVRVSAPASAPDFILNQAQVARFDADGRLAAVVDGQVMRHYADQDRLQIDQLVLSARGPQGEGLHATALRGEANREAEQVTLEGGARVLAQPAPDAAAGQGLRRNPARFEGDSLLVDTRHRVVSSDRPVTLTQGANVVHAQSLRHDDATGLTELKGRVQGRYDLASRP